MSPAAEKRALHSAFRKLLEKGLTQAEVLGLLHDADPTMKDNAGTIEAARFEYENDDVEIDAKPLLSESENGCWVSAWVFVYNS